MGSSLRSVSGYVVLDNVICLHVQWLHVVTEQETSGAQCSWHTIAPAATTYPPTSQLS